MPDLQQFRDFATMSNALIAKGSHEQLAEVAQILALSLADYRLRFGELPPAYHLDMARVEDMDEEKAKLVTEGSVVLFGMLAAVVGGLDEFEPPVH